MDYDESNLKLHIVDKGFIIWLMVQDRKELLDMAGLPNEQYDQQFYLDIYDIVLILKIQKALRNWKKHRNKAKIQNIAQQNGQ